MKYINMLGFACVVVGACMTCVGAGAASATVLCTEKLTTSCGASGWDYPATTIFEATSTGVGVSASAGGTVLDECEDSTLVGQTSGTGGNTLTVTGRIERFDWGTCTKTTDTIRTGEFQIHWISGTDNGTFTPIGIEWTTNTVFGSCVYAMSDMGTLEGGNPAKISIIKLPLKKVSGNFACPAELLWTDSFEVKKPKPLYVSES